MAKLDELEVGVTVHKCKECEYKNGAQQVYLDPDSDMIILEPTTLIHPDVKESVRKRIIEQFTSGVIVVPLGFKVIVAPRGTVLDMGMTTGDNK